MEVGENIFKILHVASFVGNIGDNASHIGLEVILNRTLSFLDKRVVIEKIEIRRFYKNYDRPDKLYFDENFCKKANSYDLLIIGGGGFLDFWVPNSNTGTTIDISLNDFKKLSVPIMMTSLGCIPQREVPSGNIEKFKRFVECVIEKDNSVLAVRNDGSSLILNNILGSVSSRLIPCILDNGFFFRTNELTKIIHQPYIAVNIAKDQLYMRNPGNIHVAPEFFMKEMVNYVNNILRKTELKIVFVPHIFSDLAAIQQLLSSVHDFDIRNRIIVAPYIQGDGGCALNFSIYAGAEFVVGMRFHSNVCNLGMNKSVRGLAVLDRVNFMYDSIGANKLSVNVNEPFSDYLFNETISGLGKPLDEKIISNIEKKKEESLNVYNYMLNKILKTN